MKLFVKKAAPKKAEFTAINKSSLKQVKGGTKKQAQTADADVD